MAVEQWVKDLTEDVIGGQPFKAGDVVPHPSGRTVKIMNGQYWAERGFSNFWTWKEVRADGSLGPDESGYGWNPKELDHATESTTPPSGAPKPLR